MLTTESFNALLKTLEEPPEHTLFIFATTDVHKVPLTIISRCQRFDFRRIELNAIKKLLNEIAVAEGIKIDDMTLTLIAKKADGALRDAQSLFDQIISFSGNQIDNEIVSKMLNLIDEEIYFTISDSIVKKNFSAAFDISQKIYYNGWNFVDFLNGLNEHFRNILTIVIRKNADLVEEADIYKEKYLKYIDKFSESDLLRILSYINKTQYELKSSTNQKLKVEIALCHLIGLENSSSISQLLDKLNNTAVSVTQNNRTNNPSFTVPSKKNINSNLTAVAKDELKIPDVKTFEVPNLSNSKDLQDIISKWEYFVEQVKNDKLFFGSILFNSVPTNYINDKVLIEVEHLEDLDIINENKPYLEKKTKEVFGKKIELDFGGKLADKHKRNQVAAKTNSASMEKVDDNPLVNTVITQLGGKEIRRTTVE